MKTTSHHRAGHSFNKVISTHSDIRIYKSDQICTVSFWKCAKRNERRVNVTTKTVSKMKTTIDHRISFAWHGCNSFPQRVHWCCAYFEVFLHWTKSPQTNSFFPSTIPFCGENFFVNTKTVSIPLNTAAFLWSFSRSVRAHWPKKQNAGWWGWCCLVSFYVFLQFMFGLVVLLCGFCSFFVCLELYCASLWIRCKHVDSIDFVPCTVPRLEGFKRIGWELFVSKF